MLQFPQGFLWGASTSAYQIEGAVNEDGRGESIWDRFAHTPGKTANGDTGDVACDHYHRYPEDVKLMAELGLNSYHLTFAWPRIQPSGKGPADEKGLAFYDRLVDSLCAAGIAPMGVLYHWDLPQALDDEGGWLNRDIAKRFADYAELISRRLGDRVSHWATFNEPWCVSMLGYYTGEHAPGHQDPTLKEANQALHHVFLAHGMALPVLRANSPQAKQGIILNMWPAYPASDSEQDRAAAERFHRFQNLWFSAPLFKGEYPADLWQAFGAATPEVQPGDLELISAPLDFLGINYYTRMVVAHDEQSNPPLAARMVNVEGAEYTDIGWEVYPQGLEDLLTQIYEEYHPKELIVTENGCAMPDVLDAEGKVHDARRSAFLKGHLQSLHRAISKGLPVKGYFIWSILDNFEWAEGYSKRFGLVYVDYATQQRIPKDSYRFMQGVIRENSVEEE